MEITEVRVKLMDEPGERLQAFCSDHLRRCLRGPRPEDHRGRHRPVRGDAQPQADRPLLRNADARIISAPPTAISAARGRRSTGRQRRRRPRQALCRHRPPDQLRLPRDDPTAGHPGVRGRKGPVEAARLCARVMMTSTTKTCCRLRLRRNPPLRRPSRPLRARPRKSEAEEKPHGPHKTPSQQPRIDRPHDRGFGAGIFEDH